jgi:hypothetical protein
MEVSYLKIYLPGAVTANKTLALASEKVAASLARFRNTVYYSVQGALSREKLEK